MHCGHRLRGTLPAEPVPCTAPAVAHRQPARAGRWSGGPGGGGDLPVGQYRRRLERCAGTAGPPRPPGQGGGMVGVAVVKDVEWMAKSGGRWAKEDILASLYRSGHLAHELQPVAEINDIPSQNGCQ